MIRQECIKDWKIVSIYPMVLKLYFKLTDSKSEAANRCRMPIAASTTLLHHYVPDLHAFAGRDGVQAEPRLLLHLDVRPGQLARQIRGQMFDA